MHDIHSLWRIQNTFYMFSIVDVGAILDKYLALTITPSSWLPLTRYPEF